ncbi:hypothetical protein CEXT_804831 [Caerostris extrusa]|uniref:Uncharacterized protein n=1 Tax=Caerostris extrusa TaxID=172846 RepID=A0AAV4WFF4_CAEEX|nr:hypothetical protein CEXT_804831 [Caerostris extrusa]
MASHTNLNKLEVVQHSAARIITGLRHSCQMTLCFLRDLPPLSMRRTCCLTKIFLTSFYSYYEQHRISTYLHTWTDNRRLKKHSTFFFFFAKSLNPAFSDLRASFFGIPSCWPET